MAESERLAINEKSVVHETIDGEVLAINLDTGTYYSLRGTGAQIWSCLASGADVATVKRLVADAHEGDRTLIAAEVSQFLEKLRDEQLVAPTEAPSVYVTHQTWTNDATKIPYSPPVVEVYSDMQDLLLLDPIHETDDSGWPVHKPVTG